MDTSVHWPRSHGQGNKAKVTRGATGEREVTMCQSGGEWILSKEKLVLNFQFY